MPREGHDGAVSVSDRSLRLRSACDPGTPVEVLFELAMEFPDQVAANPVLALALASQPDCICSATDVALACIMSSPALPDAVGGALESLILDRAAAALDSPAASAAEYVRTWRAFGARRVLVDVSAPREAPDGLPVAFERAVRGRVILAARLGVGSFSACYDEDVGAGSSFEATDGSSAAGSSWPRALIPAPPDCGHALSQSCDWERQRGEAIVALEKDAFLASARMLIADSDAVALTLFFNDVPAKVEWANPLTEDGASALRTAAGLLRESSAGLAADELVIVCGASSEGASRDLTIGTIERSSLEAYLAEGEEVLADGPIGEAADEETDETDEEESPEAAPASGLFALLKRVDPPEFGWALFGGKSCGGYDEFVEAVRPSATESESRRTWHPAAVEALFKSVFPAGQLEWIDGALRSTQGAMEEGPVFFVALADASGAAAFVMMHFPYADGWREWRLLTDPLVDVSS